MLPNATLLGLGNIVKADGTPAPWWAEASGDETMVSLTHYTADGVEYLPLWSDPGALIDSTETYPEWASLKALILEGDGLLESLSPATWIVINPWTDVEFSIPPRVAGT